MLSENGILLVSILDTFIKGKFLDKFIKEKGEDIWGGALDGLDASILPVRHIGVDKKLSTIKSELRDKYTAGFAEYQCDILESLVELADDKLK